MGRRNRTSSRVRHIGAGLGMAGAAAIIASTGAPAARADDLSTDIAFLNAAAADVNEAFSLSGRTPIDADLFNQMEAVQTPLLSSDNSFLSGLGDALFNGPDRQLAQSADTFLSATQAYTADPSAVNGLADVSAALQFDGTLLGNELPATIVGKIVDEFAGLSTATRGAATDVAASAATISANEYDPASFLYSADPNNVFSPVYNVAPTGAETVTATDASGDVFGTQDFSVSTFGIPLSTFTGYVEYSPGDDSNPLALLFGNPYIEDINVTGVPGTLLPENTGFLVTQFGGGWGNVLEEANITGSSTTVGDFLETPFGNENITPIIEYLMNYTGSLTEAASAVDPSSLADLLSSIGL
jgi:hypothetical protein